MNDTTTSTFVCNHDEDAEEHIGELYDAVHKLWGGRYLDRPFVSNAIDYLWFDHSIEIDGIYTDMWSAIKANKMMQPIGVVAAKRLDTSEREVLQEYWVETDVIEDGLAWLILYVADALPESWKE